MTWSTLPPLPLPRADCQAGFVTYPDRSKGILVAGGEGQTKVEFLNLDTLTWEPKQYLPVDIHKGASVPYKDSFLMVGGYSSDVGETLDTIYYYDPNLDQWDLLEQKMKMRRKYFAAFLVSDQYANCN